MPLTGWPRHTLVRGAFVVKDGVVVAEAGSGEYVRALGAGAAEHLEKAAVA